MQQAMGSSAVAEWVLGTHVNLYNFSLRLQPAALIQDAADNLDGTASRGGANGEGTVFELAPVLDR